MEAGLSKFESYVLEHLGTRGKMKEALSCMFETWHNPIARPLWSNQYKQKSQYQDFVCHIYYTKYSITFKLPHGKGNECKRDVCMIAPCISNLIKAFLLFPALSFFFFLSNNICKFLYLLSFHFKVFSSKFYILLLSLYFEHSIFQRTFTLSIPLLSSIILQTCTFT